MQQLFNSIVESTEQPTITLEMFLVCITVSLAAGFLLAVTSMWRVSSSKSFMATLAILPAAVCAVIMMVNGNFGTGVAVAGCFALVRFRSAAGNAREIGAVFASMGIGLMTGMGYLSYAILFAAIIGGTFMIYTVSDFGDKQAETMQKEIRITIPEDLDYCGVFDPVFEKYTENYKLIQVKTTHMGSLFKLIYEFTLTDSAMEKALIDELRMRNGNLEIMVSYQENAKNNEL